MKVTARRKRTHRTCSVEGCGREHACKGLCSMHYKRMSRHGSLEDARFRHRMSDTVTYTVWCSIMRRCYTPGQENYPRYGGKGIRVAKRWHRFEGFYRDMGPRPDGCVIHRLDSSKGYTPENTIWTLEEYHNWLHKNPIGRQLMPAFMKGYRRLRRNRSEVAGRNVCRDNYDVQTGKMIQRQTDWRPMIVKVTRAA